MIMLISSLFHLLKHSLLGKLIVPFALIAIMLTPFSCSENVSSPNTAESSVASGLSQIKGVVMNTDINARTSDELSYSSSKGVTEVAVFEKDIMLIHNGDQAFTYVFQVEHSIPSGHYVLSNSEIVFNDRTLFLEDTEEKKLYTFFLNYVEYENMATKTGEKVKVDLGSSFTEKNDVKMFGSYGTAVFPELYEYDSEVASRFDNAADYIYHMDYSSNNSRLSQNTTAPIDVGGDCAAGGPGASNCEISSTLGPIESSCKVTCLGGYYACCTANARCNCRPYSPSSNDPGNGGGGGNGGGSGSPFGGNGGGGGQEECELIDAAFEDNTIVLTYRCPA